MKDCEGKKGAVKYFLKLYNGESQDDGINLCDADNNYIMGNHIFMNKHEGIHLYEDTNNNIIRNNNISDNDLSGIAMGNPGVRACTPGLPPVGAGINNVIDNNTISRNGIRGKAPNPGSAYDGIFMVDTTLTTISNNEIFSNGDHGINLYDNCPSNTIKDNNISNNGVDGIRLEKGSDNNEILRNKITKNKQNGVYLIDSGSNHINDNSAINENGQDGVRLENKSNNNEILRNTITKNKQNGVYLIDSGSNHINDNPAINENDQDGVRLENKSDNNEILRNKITKNKQNGVHLIDSNSNFIETNEISDNQHGILSDSSNSVTIRRNNNIHDNSLCGILLVESNSDCIEYNQIHDNGVDGTRLENSNENDIRMNDVLGNGRHGMYLITSNSNPILDNSVSNNRVDGIKLKESNDNRIESNDVLGNGRHGVHFFNSTNNNIDENIITDNGGHGVYDHPYSQVGALSGQIFASFGNLLVPNGIACGVAPAVPWQNPVLVAAGDPAASFWCLDTLPFQDYPSAIGIEADRTTTVELDTVTLIVTGVAGDKIKVEADPLSEYVIFKEGVDDTPTGADFHGNWFTDVIDSDGIRKYAIEFYDTGTYTLRATVKGGLREGSYDTVDITVLEKAVEFDMPNTAIIGERITVKGTSTSGSWVSIWVDDTPYQQLQKLVLEDGEFSKEVTTTDIGMTVPGSVRLKAWIDTEATGEPPTRTADGEAGLLLQVPLLTADLSTPRVAVKDDFKIEGHAPGSTNVWIMAVPPKGGGGKALTEERKGITTQI